MLRTLIVLLLSICFTDALSAGLFRATVIDDQSRKPIAARVYLQSSEGDWLFVKSSHPEGSALPYREQWVPMPNSVEKHTTVSAHPFEIDLAPGKYKLTVERGKEYHPTTITISIQDRDVDIQIPLERWIDLASRGWYSGETHVHRRIVELPNVMQAEDLNVAFPVTFWTTVGGVPPGLDPSPLRRQGPSPFGPRENRGAEPIYLDRSHVILPRNTEYEIFSLEEGKARHVLGAIFLLNHQSRFTKTAPPIWHIAEQAHEEGALLDLDKHSWPWSMMLVPIAKVDLFELSNNSVWRTNFGFKNTTIQPASWMNVERESETALTEWGWLNFGFEMYYALLNCGFDLTPTAGTASGVHPVPLGYSRVYVHTGEQFHLAEWLSGLKQGRSFVTTGPMLFAKVNGKLSGERFEFEKQTRQTYRVEVESVSERPISSIEILVNGQVVETIKPVVRKIDNGAYSFAATKPVTLDESGWIAVRSVEEQPDGRKRFAHTAPWFVEMNGRARNPRREQIDYLIDLMEHEIKRNRDVLDKESFSEFEAALSIYQSIKNRLSPSGKD